MPANSHSTLYRYGWPTSWDQPRSLGSAAEALAFIVECRSRDRIMLQVLTNVRDIWPLGRRHRIMRRYLASASAQVNAFARAVQRRAARQLNELSDEDLVNIILAAPEITAWHADDGRPIARPRLKSDGLNYRWIHSSGAFQYARELLTAGASRAATTSLPTQFMSGKGGTPRFEKWLRERLPTAKLIITLDIPRCFALMKRSSVADALPLPEKVINQVLFVPMARTKYLWPGPKGSMPMGLVSIAQASLLDRGIAEGHALSNVASELVLANVLRDVLSVDSSVYVASHADNLIVLMDDAQFEEPVTQALMTSICLHFDVEPGELAGRISRTTARREFNFCRRRYLYVKGKLRVRLPADHLSRFEDRTLEAIQEAQAIKTPAERNIRVDRLKRSILGWLQQSKINAGAVELAVSLMGLIPPALNESQSSEGPSALIGGVVDLPALEGKK